MEPRYLLDTNICIYIRQKRPEEVLRRFRKLRPGKQRFRSLPTASCCMAQLKVQNGFLRWSDCASL